MHILQAGQEGRTLFFKDELVRTVEFFWNVLLSFILFITFKFSLFKELPYSSLIFQILVPLLLSQICKLFLLWSYSRKLGAIASNPRSLSDSYTEEDNIALLTPPLFSGNTCSDFQQPETVTSRSSRCIWAAFALNTQPTHNQTMHISTLLPEDLRKWKHRSPRNACLHQKITAQLPFSINTA